MIVERCVGNGVGRINIGDLICVREDENGESKNWDRHGNLDLHGWAFDRFTTILEYNAKAEGIEVVEVSERGTSKTCCVCGTEDTRQRVERGLYVCGECDDAFNDDVNGAENIRLDVNETESNSTSSASLDGDRSSDWVAQPGVSLYDLPRGFVPRDQVGDSKPYYPTAEQIGDLRCTRIFDSRDLGILASTRGDVTRAWSSSCRWSRCRRYWSR